MNDVTTDACQKRFSLQLIIIIVFIIKMFQREFSLIKTGSRTFENTNGVENIHSSYSILYFTSIFQTETEAVCFVECAECAVCVCSGLLYGSMLQVVNNGMRYFCGR